LRVALGVYADEPSGLAVGTVDTALALDDAGIDLRLFALEGSRLPDRADRLLDRVTWVERPPLQGRIAATAAFLASRLAASTAFARALRGHEFDVVHVFSPGMASRLPRGIRVSTQAWFHPPRLLDRLRIMMPFTSRRALYPAALMLQVQAHLSDLAGYRRADLVIGNTEPARDALLERGFDATCVPPALEIPNERSARERSEAFRLVFCSTGLGAPRKGLRFLLEALELAEHRPLEVTLIGEPDPSLDPAFARLRERGVGVTLLGRVPRERYLGLLAGETDVLAFPSLYEEWGYALFEALGRGVPAIAFDLYPFSEILDARTGVLVPPRDVGALAAAIDRAAAGGLPDCAEVREATRERFGSVSVAERLLEAWS
jgi:glycosyltransferase involved in cell wall biosynthesis